MTTLSSVTSLLIQQDDLLLQIDAVDTKLAVLQQSMKVAEGKVNALKQDRKRLGYSLWEFDKALIELICPTDEVLRRFSSSVNSLRNPDHPSGGALAIDQRWADLGFTQSSSEG